MLGVALQTCGIVMALSALGTGRRSRSLILAAYAAFGAALCVKQTYIVAPAITTALLVAARVRGRLPSRAVGQGVLLALMVLSVVYGADWLVTGGRMFEPVFIVAGSLGRLRPADWARVVGLLGEVVIGSVGITVLLTAAGLGVVGARPGKARGAVAAAGALLLIATLAVYVVGGRERWYDAARVFGCEGALLTVFIGCALIEPKGVLGNPIDAALWAYWSGEFALTVSLFRASTGAWTNYALPAVLLGCVLTARSLARAFERARSPLPLMPAALASLAVFYLAWVDVSNSRHRRENDHATLEAVLGRIGRDPHEIFFVGRPGLNRVHGRTDLVYDEWLYPVFESVNLADRRSSWLRKTLESGSVRYVVVGTADPRIEGLDRDLTMLGFAPSFRLHHYYVWERTSFPGRADSSEQQGAKTDDRSKFGSGSIFARSLFLGHQSKWLHARGKVNVGSALLTFFQGPGFRSAQRTLQGTSTFPITGSHLGVSQLPVLATRSTALSGSSLPRPHQPHPGLNRANPGGEETPLFPFGLTTIAAPTFLHLASATITYGTATVTLTGPWTAASTPRPGVAPPGN